MGLSAMYSKPEVVHIAFFIQLSLKTEAASFSMRRVWCFS